MSHHLDASMDTGAGKTDNRIALLFSLLVWAGTTGGSLVLTARYACNIPRADDWSKVPRVASQEPTVSNLWRQSIESRSVLFLAWNLAWQFAPGNLPAAMVGGLVILSVECLLLIFMAKWARGRALYTDAIFPLALLHFGHAVNFLWWEQAWALAAFGLLALLFGLLAQPAWYCKTWAVTCAAIVVAVFTLTSFSPKAASPVLAVGLIALGAYLWSGRHTAAGNRKRATIAAIGGVVGLLAFLWSTHGDKSVYPHPEAPVAYSVVRAAEFLAISFGLIAKRTWPASGGVALLTLIGTALLLLQQLIRSPHERVRPAVFLVALVAWCFVGFVVGYKRGLQGGMIDRYALYSAPFLCAAYLAWSVFPSAPPRLARIVRFGLFAILLAASSYHFSEGRRQAVAHKQKAEAFYEDVRAGIPMEGIVARHQEAWGINERSFREGVELLKAVGISPFAEIASDQVMDEKPLPIVPTAHHHMTLSGCTWQGSGRRARLDFVLDGPQFAYAVRLKYLLRNNRGSSLFKLSWVRADVDNPFDRVASAEVLVNFNTARQRREEVLTVWINDRISAFAISPSEGPFEFSISAVSILGRPEQFGDDRSVGVSPGRYVDLSDTVGRGARTE